MLTFIEIFVIKWFLIDATKNPPEWILISSVHPVSSSTSRSELMKTTESATTLSTSSISPTSTQRPAIVPETTRFPTRKPQITSSPKTTTITVPITTDDDIAIITEGTTMLDSFDETTIVTEVNDQTDHMITQPIYTSTSTTSKVTYSLEYW